jgi:exo-beta-1,3-glucanase (GH17 family)
MRLRIVKVMIALGVAGATALRGGIAITNLPSFKPFLGIAYSPFRGNESPNYGTYPTVDDITQDITNNLVFLASEIATYSMDGTQSNIPSLCNAYNLPCYPCAFVSSSDPTDNSNEISALIAVGNQNFPTTRGLIVGTESLLNGYDVNALISDIKFVRAATHTNVPVGTRDVATDFISYPALVADCDFIQADIHPYWAAEPESDAVAYTIQQWQMLTNQFPGVRVEIGETGWPTGGTNAYWNNGQVVPSVANQGKYLSEFVPVANSMGIEYFIFDFRDELWKVQAGNGTIETNWGLYDAGYNKKQSLVDFQQNGFVLRMMSGDAHTANILVPTFAANPYSLLGTTNLLVNPWVPISTFIGAGGTNQTVISVPDSGSQSNWFYRAAQNF